MGKRLKLHERNISMVEEGTMFSIQRENS